MNNVVLMGRLTRNPEMRTGQTEASTVTRFTVAVDRRFKKDGQQDADFIGCVAFGKTAEFISKYFVQGSKICLNGRIQTGSYKDKNGNTVYTTDVVVEGVEFAESKKAEAPNNNAFANTEAANDGFVQTADSLNDSGLPFR